MIITKSKRKNESNSVKTRKRARAEISHCRMLLAVILGQIIVFLENHLHFCDNDLSTPSTKSSPKVSDAIFFNFSSSKATQRLVGVAALWPFFRHIFNISKAWSCTLVKLALILSISCSSNLGVSQTATKSHFPPIFFATSRSVLSVKSFLRCYNHSLSLGRRIVPDNSSPAPTCAAMFVAIPV